MDTNRKSWYSRGLGPRVDALEVALKAHQQRDDKAAKNIRMIAESLRVSSPAYGFFEVFEAARMVEEASAGSLADRTRNLIKVLRHELADEPLLPATILLVGEPNLFMASLGRELEPLCKEVLQASTSEQAQRFLKDRDIVFIVLDLFLPDQDGRYFLEILRSRADTAAIPIVVLAAKGNEAVRNRKLVPDADACFIKPADVGQVAEFIQSRLRRVHEVRHAARRDVLTGLLNRAAFCEDFEEVLKSSQAGREPVALALLELDRLHEIEKVQGSAFVDQVMRHAGQILSSTFRATDVVSRWNASQFVVLLPGEDQFSGMRAIEKAIQALRKSPLARENGAELPLTLSGGLTVLSGHAGVDDIIEEADRFLFAAKSGGGNQVMTLETTEKRRAESVMVFVRDDIARVLKPLLGKNGFDVVPSSAEAEAMLEDLAKARCRLVVLEDDNAGFSGFEMLSRIRANVRFNRIPVVMLVSDETSAARALGLGANDYLLKPFMPSVFITRMRDLLTRGAEPDQPSRTLLLMEADITTLIIAGTTIHKRTGMRVLLAGSGVEGLARLKQETVDAVLLDPQMLDMKGDELVNRVVEAAAEDKIPVVLASSSTGLAGFVERVGKDIRGVIVKPYNLQQLPDELMGVLNFRAHPSSKPPADEARQFNAEIQRIMRRPAASPKG